MKKTSLLLATALTLFSLTACGNNNSEDEIVKIDAINKAGDATGQEREREDTNKEPVVRPDQKDTNQHESQQEEQPASPTRQASVYGIWNTLSWDSLAVYNSPDGVKFSLYDASTDQDITGTVETDDSTFIEFTYLQKQEQPEEQQQPSVEEQPTDENGENIVPEGEAINPYDSDEEFYEALAQQQKEKYITERYNIEKLEYDKELNIMFLTISGQNKTYEFRMDIYEDTPDYSLEDNSLSR